MNKILILSDNSLQKQLIISHVNNFVDSVDLGVRHLGPKKSARAGSVDHRAVIICVAVQQRVNRPTELGYSALELGLLFLNIGLEVDKRSGLESVVLVLSRDGFDFSPQFLHLLLQSLLHFAFDALHDSLSFLFDFLREFLGRL